MKNILLLGSTGSIGKSALDVVSQNPDEFRVRTLVTNTNISLLADQITRYKPDNAIIFDYTAYCEFEKNYSFTDMHIGFGNDALYHVMKNGDHDSFINAFVGFAGLEPTARAIDIGLDIALANKETLVVAGELIMKLINQNNHIWWEKNHKIRPPSIWEQGEGFIDNIFNEIRQVCSGCRKWN